MLTEIDTMQKEFGNYPVTSFMPLLREMELFELALGLLGLIFGIIVLLLIAISVLLLFSLLQNSVDTKTRDHGIMRLCGLT